MIKSKFKKYIDTENLNLKKGSREIKIDRIKAKNYENIY